MELGTSKNEEKARYDRRTQLKALNSHGQAAGTPHPERSREG